jgi:hypothetical protein
MVEPDRRTLGDLARRSEGAEPIVARDGAARIAQGPRRPLIGRSNRNPGQIAQTANLKPRHRGTHCARDCFVPRTVLTFRLLLLLLLSLLITLPLTGCGDHWGDGSESSADALTETSTAAPPVKGAVASLKTAIEEDAAVDARLSHALTRIGAMITPEQHRSYARAFEQLPDVKATRASYHNAAKLLDGELAKLLATDATTAEVMAGLKQRMPVGGRGAVADVVVFGPQDLFDAYALLATTPYALRALQFGQRLIDQDPRLANVNAQVSQEDVAERIIMPGLPGTYLDQLVRLGSSEAAVRQLKLVLGQGPRLRVVANWLDKHIATDTSDPTMDRISIGGKNIAEALHTVAAIMVIWELGVDLSRGDIDSALQTIVLGGPTAVGGVAHAVSLLRRLLVGAPTTEIAEKIAAVATRFGQHCGRDQRLRSHQ